VCAGGFGSTLLGLDKKTYELAGASPANVPGSYKDPGFGWMAGFVAAISFAGLLSLIPLRKVLYSACTNLMRSSLLVSSYQ
jgi:hypothetical protein